MIKTKTLFLLTFLMIIYQINGQELNKLKTNTQNQVNNNIQGRSVVGYYAGWAIYGRDYLVSDILPVVDKYTHINYAFYKINWNASTNTAKLESTDTFQDDTHIKHYTKTNDPDWNVAGNIAALKVLKDKAKSEKNHDLKLVLSIGGWTLSQEFPLMANSVNGRKSFAKSCVDWLKQNPHFDGIDLDWEFPVKGGYDGNEIVNGKIYPAQTHSNNDALNLLLLVKEMRETFTAEGIGSKEISMAMANDRGELTNQFIGKNNMAHHGRTDNLFDYIDFATFFGYDLGGAWNDVTCYNAPLYPSSNMDDPLYRASNNQGEDESWSVTGLMDTYKKIMGDDISKIYVGIPYYGKMFGNVADSKNNETLKGLYAPSPRNTLPAKCSGKGLPAPPPGSWDLKTNAWGGTYDFECERTGSIDYLDLIGGDGVNITYPHYYLDKNNPTQVVDSAANAGWVRYWDDTAKVPYLYNDTTNEFISYDDPTSLALKIDKILSEGFGGLMVWEISQDIRQRNTDGLIDVVNNTITNLMLDIALNFLESDQTTPINGVTVTLKDANGTVINTLNTDANGNISFNDIAAYKAYSVDFSSSNFTFSPSNISIADLTKSENLKIIGTSTLNINQYELNNSITLHPNPVNDKLTIDLKENLKITSIKMFDIIGKEVIINSMKLISYL